ncbi:transcriptional elongation regulator MINIYO [Selaginella moellendorffii]|uniref:transcriptional elongation regulator MINIYO n=1 Tax=Selaginella moellendorffii TaxID=88036 RepID=UPI000D1C619A|nr:transcriptional elongation regulator MINIYO [Selaginella moellendorffii]|eukprot:XP_024529166.1 transcriptional elongation regulator MINIYO [Selaginella moellendorffii]
MEYEPLGVLGEIKEKGFSAAGDSSPQLPAITALPFPVARHRSHGPHWGVFSPRSDEIVDLDEPDGPLEGGRDAARPLQRKSRDDSRWKEVAAAAAAAAQGKDAVPSQAQEIDAENRARISSMSSQEISDAHRELLERLGPEKIKMLQRRGMEKEKQRFGEKNPISPEDGDKSAKTSTSTATPKDAKMQIPVRANEQEKSVKVVAGVMTSAWTERVEAIKSMRFSLDGEVISSSNTDMQDDSDLSSVAQRDYLRAEGDPSALGYTIKEAALLSRSTVPAHRAAGVQLLGTIFSNAASGLQDGRNDYDWQAVWAYCLGPQPELTLTLRLALDDTNLTSVVSCAKALQAMLSSSQNDDFFNLCERSWPGGPLWWTAPVFRKRSNHEEDGYLGGGYWKYNVKSSELLLSQVNNNDNDNSDTTVADDATVATKDVAAGFIRMGVLPRIRYILEVEKLDAAVNAALLSTLVAFARHSPAAAKAVMECPRLINSVIQRFLLPEEDDDTPLVPLVRAKAIQLLKVLSQASKSYCVHFAELGALQTATSELFEWSYRLTMFPRAAAADLSKDSAILQEALRLWKICIFHGIGISLFADFHPALSAWLSSASSGDPAIYNLAQESYSVLEVLARTLPVMVKGQQHTQASHTGWSWSIAVPMVKYGLSWLEESSQGSEAEVMALGSVLHFLATVCERVRPEGLPDLVLQVEQAFDRVQARLVSTLRQSSTVYAKLTLANFLHATARLASGLEKLGRETKQLDILLDIAKEKRMEMVNLGSLHGEEHCGCTARGGPAPGLGVGWSSRVPGGGFCSSKLLVARVYASGILRLLELEKGSSSISLKTKLNLTALLTEPSSLERALSRHILSEERWLLTLDDAVKRINQGKGLYDTTQFKGGREFLLQHFTKFWLQKKQPKQHDLKKKLETIKEEETEEEDEEKTANSTVLLREWKGTRLPLPCHWILSPLHSKSSDVTLAGLLLLLGLEEGGAASDIPIVRKVHALSTVFAAGDTFLEEPVSDALGSLQDIYFEEARGALDFQSGVDADYALFAEGLAQNFAAASYGDLRFGRQVAFYLRSGTDVSIHGAVWRCLAQAEVLSLLPPVEECGPGVYFDPPQRSIPLLDMFVSSWITGGLDRAFLRKALPFRLALHHVAHFVLNAGDDETLLLHRQKFARSISRASRRNRESKEMLRELLHYFPDKLEQSQRFLKEAGGGEV